ncbi:protein BatD [Winogradskyella echinorum]|uniref:Protein BatD n=1 Tax=Winogradskyella echinorum TaxID=538189 RepID=A0ABR6XZQ1_9FLAO|nr:BatD family protein [Winogradskyella echinorum]MBC3845961.1 protein BatD [Winogradskyella echinorum]MBC5750309.1 protein BatD [Winogradskyella echinorum]
MKLTKHISILFLVLATSIASAQVKFEAKVSKKKLGVNERLRIDFEMNQDGDNFVPPSFKDFTVVGGPNTSLMNSYANGKKTYSKTYSYFLAPKKRGTFTIKQATIEIDGETYKTFPITVTVTAAVDRPNGAPDASDIASDNIHLVAEVSNSNPYLNEAITVVYKLYVSKETGVSGWSEKDSPRYNDFWNQNIEVKGFPTQRGQYKGEDYRYVVVRKTVLYPQKTGKLKLEPLVLEVMVEVPTGRANIFGQQMMTQVPQTVTAGSRTINVKQLPEEGKPSDFKGAVGDFDFNITTTKTQLNATESLQAKVEVTGKGNLKLFELPKLTVPSSLEVYEPEHKENVRTNLSGMRGSISDTYTLVPQYRGKYPVPTISFSYFDLKTESYKRITSDEIVIDVLEGPTAANNSENATVANTKQTVTSNNNTFAFIKTSSNWVSTLNQPFFKSTGFWSMLLLPFLAIPLAIVIRRKKDERDADVTGNRIRKADRLAKKYLGAAKKALGQKEAFYEALERALHNYLKAKLNIETSDFNKEKIENLLGERQIEENVVSDFISILENCELARYTPITQVTMQNDYDKAAKTISLIDKQMR